MNNIPPKLRQEMADDPYYKRCCVTGATNEKIEWHHNLIYAGKQVQEKWCILPLAYHIHAVANDKLIRERLDWVMLNRGTDDDLKRYSKGVDLLAKRDRLNKRYGTSNKILWDSSGPQIHIRETGDVRPVHGKIPGRHSTRVDMQKKIQTPNQRSAGRGDEL